jgi:hypothetical protein
MSTLSRRAALRLSVRALFWLSSTGCDEGHRADASGDADVGRPYPDSGTATTLDAARCDDHGAIVDDLVLTGEVSAEDPCSVRIVTLPHTFEPARFKVQVDRIGVRPANVDSEDGMPAYVLTGDVVRITDDACARIRERQSQKVSISLRYGSCRNWE